MSQTTTQAADQRVLEGRNWPPGYGFRQRLREAVGVLFGRWSMHRAWQRGMEYGAQQEYVRVLNGGDGEFLAMIYLDRMADAGGDKAPPEFKAAADQIAASQSWLARSRERMRGT